ncbi:hypothetical protein DL96DRAFT_1729748 [Flagelloscypha sp. PMI_526]|nr:hypothetical protein DL96DRAFT_1729748 [Flagelloscypha sp. PMI_526]
MPKSSKKRKDKAADFSKSKLKLGKGKQLATNAIDTSFKARSIALPTQSIALEKDQDEPLTRRKADANVRKDAISGLKELFTSYPSLIQESLPRVFSASARLICDEESGVRKTLLTFYTSLLPQIAPDSLQPYAPTLLLFATAAQTHIFPEIRVESLRFIDLFLEYMPSSVTQGWDTAPNSHGSRIADGYLSMLNAGTRFDRKKDGTPEATSNASVVISPASRLVIYESLAAFLSCALESTDGLGSSNAQLDLWYMAPNFSNKIAFECFSTSLCPSITKRVTRVVWNDDDPAMNLIPPSSNISQASVKASSEFIAARSITRALHGPLLSAILDYLPSMNQNPSETEVRTLLMILRILSSLYSTAFRTDGLSTDESVFNELGTITRHLHVYFLSRQDLYETEFQTINLLICQLSTLHLFGSNNSKSSSAPSSLANVVDYISSVLKNDPNSLQRPITSAAYTAMLPSIWTMMLNEARSRTSGGALKKGETSSLKAAIHHIFVLRGPQQSYPIPHFLTSPCHARALDSWMTHLPKVLWELGASNISLTTTILRFLLRAFQRRSMVLQSTTTRQAVAARCIPYFSSVHATRGVILGPFAKIQDKFVRRLALDLAFILTVDSDVGKTEELLAAVDRAVSEGVDSSYWTQLRSSIPLDMKDRDN